jgi:hypothetical protein
MRVHDVSVTDDAALADDIFNMTRTYRGTWDEVVGPPGRGSVMVIMKHPSWPDERNTSLAEARRMAKNLTFSTLCVVNLFARRARTPGELNQLPFDVAVHESNDAFIGMGLDEADLVVAAWGGPNGVTRDIYKRRVEEVVELVGPDRLVAFGVTAAGHPRHCLDWRRRGRGHMTDWCLEAVAW